MGCEVPIARAILLRRGIKLVNVRLHGDTLSGVTKSTAGGSHDTILPKGPTTDKLAGGYACIVQGGYQVRGVPFPCPGQSAQNTVRTTSLS